MKKIIAFNEVKMTLYSLFSTRILQLYLHSSFGFDFDFKRCLFVADSVQNPFVLSECP